MKRIPALPLTWGGECSEPSLETEYQAEHLTEHGRHARLMFACAAALNLLFFFSDFRFAGQAHFPAAIAARAVIVLASAGVLALARRVDGFRGLQRLCAAWCAAVIPACAVLISPRTDVALIIIFVLPIIFYLIIPMSFRWTLCAGGTSSAVFLLVFFGLDPAMWTRPGMALAHLTLNVSLALVLMRMNRLQRLEWAATRAEHAANRELTEHRQALQSLLRAVPAPLIIMSLGSGRLIQANDVAHRYFGEGTLQHPLALRRLFPKKELRRLWASLPARGEVKEQETRLRLPLGPWRDVLLVTARTVVQGTEALLAIVVDITSRKEMEERLERLASTDPLTGLANRARFFALAEEELKRTQRYGRSLSVVMADIDFFKAINDTYGHETGDMALKAFADLCRAVVREPDSVARIGGEEFALLLPETDMPSALALAERLRSAVEGMNAADLPAAMTISLGAAVVLPGEADVHAALARADQALYAAKRGGRNRVERWSLGLAEPAPRQPTDPPA